MTEVERSKIKDQILTDIEKLKKEILNLEEMCKPIEPDCCIGDLGRFEVMYAQESSELALKESKIRLNRLNYALSKIDRENYGICEECDEAIAIARLMIVPESTLCIDCAK